MNNPHRACDPRITRGAWRLSWLVAIVALVGSLSACKSSPRGTPGPAPALSGRVTTAAAPSHDPQHPPIDCPLAKAGINPHDLKPFDDVEKYIAFLERPDRAAWQKPDEVVMALHLAGTETVVDLGAGSGYFSFRFAKALRHGMVVAADTDAEMVRHIHHRAMMEGVHNVAAQIVGSTDPEIPPEADLVFVCDVLHHVADRAAWIGKLASEMKPGARLVLIEFKEGKLPEGPPEAAKIPRAQLLALVTGAGLTLISERATLLPYQNFLVFRKPG